MTERYCNGCRKILSWFSFRKGEMIAHISSGAKKKGIRYDYCVKCTKKIVKLFEVKK